MISITPRIQLTVGEDNVGYCQKALAEADFLGRFIHDMWLGINSRRNHGHYRCNKNTDECWI